MKGIKGFQKGHPSYSEKGRIKKGENCGESNSNWKGGKSMKYKLKHAPRPKPKQCEICKEFGRICYDHDHKTDEFRGWICDRCNVALGMANEKPEILIAIAKYIKKHKKHDR
jgi:hypothetical protein